MDRKSEVKRQHYVPRMILRRFSPDGRRVALLRLADGRRVPSANLKRQCYDDYYYGQDDVMEKSFAKEEAKIAGYLGDLSPERLNALDASAIDDLRRFVHYQQARTAGAAEHLSAFVGAFAKSALRTSIQLNPPGKMQERHLDLVKIGVKGGSTNRFGSPRSPHHL